MEIGDQHFHLVLTEANEGPVSQLKLSSDTPMRILTAVKVLFKSSLHSLDLGMISVRQKNK